MAEYMHLIGAEEVRSVGNAMSGAASEMRGAASSIDSAFERHHRFLDDWLQRFEAAMERAAPPPRTDDNRTQAEKEYDLDRYSAR
ncbi:hypothetical protein [Mesorhizobium carmichaelinearum]|uniref:hypothetical protein n=1 Tax=Mesorhizobium carmichaelinearum TaxID=1208188 RepID=UPI000BA3D855|nr:hypothetical protein [Mesorhizobium carmichaelinearum]